MMNSITNTTPITIVDARMGRGKSSAAIRYMNSNKDQRKFLYVTPYLKEVERVCSSCGFKQPSDEQSNKSSNLKALLKRGNSVATTHSLFHMMNSEMLDLVRQQHYTLIIDETVDVIEKINISASDLKLIVGDLTKAGEDGCLHWLAKDYTGMFTDIKKAADAGALFHQDSALLKVMNPNVFRAFDEVFMLTYMFEGQCQRAYLDYFGFDYRIIGVKQDADGYCFSDELDIPSPMDCSRLIHIVDKPRMNAPGDERFALSRNWFIRRGRNDKDIKQLRDGLRSFFRGAGGDSNSRIWTCFKGDRSKLVSDNGRFNSSFLQIGAKATNEYRDKTAVAYMANRFIDPNVTKFFSARNVAVNQDAFALSEMLQWIWRSAIRVGKPIDLYIPSSRMRTLLVNWIEDTKGGKIQ